MYTLRKEFLNNLKKITGEIFSDETYEKIMSNQDISTNSLFGDKIFQSKSIGQIIDAMQNMFTDYLQEGLDEIGAKDSWLESKINILVNFKINLTNIIDDFQGSQEVYLSKVKGVYVKNKQLMGANSENDFLEIMKGISYNNSIRCLNVIYLNEDFIATQSFDKNNIDLFYN